MRVLVADDTAVMRAMLAEWIEGMGFTVTTANDGVEATAVAEREGFDIAVIDWEMPRLSGMDAIRALRANPKTAFSHIVLITGHDDQNRLIQALEGGADDFISKPINAAALIARLKAGARIVSMRQEIMQLASTDALTGTANRRSFFNRSDEQAAVARRSRRPLSMLAIDLDHFKKVNDTHGHAGGDKALVGCAVALRSVLRPADVLGRIGGEEFAVLLTDTTGSGAMAVAERMRAAVADAAIEHNGKAIPLTASIGVAEWPGSGGVDVTLAAADSALYRAKANGRNRVERA